MHQIRGGRYLCLAAFLAAIALHPALRGAERPAPDRLPPRAIARIGNHRFYHGPYITSAVLSPDGRRAASAADFSFYARYVPQDQRDAYARTIILWDAATGERMRTLHAPQNVRNLAFAPDGKRLAAACAECVILFDVATGKQIRQWKTEGGGRPQFSANGKQLHLNGRAGITSWSIASGKRIRQAKAPGGRDWLKEREHVMDATLSPDGTFITWRISQAPDYSKLPPGAFPPPYVPRPRALIVTRADSDQPLYRQELAAGEIQSLSFSRDGQRFLVVDGHTSSVFTSATGKKLFTLDRTPAYRGALSPDGRQAVLAWGDARVQLWDLESRKPSHELCRGLTYINSHALENPQCFSADGKWLLLRTDSTLRLFDTTTGKERSPAGHGAHLLAWFARDDELLTTCDEFRCRWRLAPDKEPILLRREARNAWEGICGNPALAHSVEGRLFVDARGSTFRLLDAKTGKILHKLENGPWSVRLGQFSPDTSKLMLGCYRLNISENGISLEGREVYRLFDTRTGKMSGQFTRGDEAGGPVFSSNGRLLAWTDCANGIHLHDAGTGKLLRILHSTRPLPRKECSDADLLFSPDSEYLAVTSYEGHRVWERDKEQHAHPIRIFHVRSGREAARFHANPEKADSTPHHSCWAWSPDNRLLAIAEQEAGTIRLLEIASGKVRAQLTGHRHGVRGLAFSPDGATLASGGKDNVVFLWDVLGTRTGPPQNAASNRDLASWWEDLRGEDAARAGAAIASFLGTPEPSAAFLGEQLRRMQAPDRKRLARLIGDLGADIFATREAASKELEQLGEQAEAALRTAQKTQREPEVTRRIRRLLGKLDRGPSRESLRRLRAVETLERLGTAEAHRCLAALAQRELDPRTTTAANESLRRRKTR